MYREPRSSGLTSNKLENSVNLLEGFSKLTREERYDRLIRAGFLSPEDVSYLTQEDPVDPELADHFIENAIGYFHLPMGVAINFKINGIERLIPMCVEETSIVAAASKTARWIRENGEITTRTLGREIIGQIQLAHVKNPFEAVQAVLDQKENLLNIANSVAAGMVKRGGGVKDIQARVIERPDEGHMVVFHILMDPCDAMGANIINQVCEALKGPIQELSKEPVTMCILSNLVDTKLTEATVRIRNIDPVVGKGIEEASLFAQLDPYRAATNNKGVMNGIDPILIATGNDWRAVEAGMHAYASISGQYKSLTVWKMIGNDLVGTLRAPVVVGTVGGVTNLHPTAKMAVRLLKVKNANELSQVVAAVGLVQNLGAVKALSTVGIVQGHMKLHAANLAIAVGAQGDEILQVQEELQKLLDQQRKVSHEDAVSILSQIREKN